MHFAAYIFCNLTEMVPKRAILDDNSTVHNILKKIFAFANKKKFEKTTFHALRIIRLRISM